MSLSIKGSAILLPVAGVAVKYSPNYYTVLRVWLGLNQTLSGVISIQDNHGKNLN